MANFKIAGIVKKEPGKRKVFRSSYSKMQNDKTEPILSVITHLLIMLDMRKEDLETKC